MIQQFRKLKVESRELDQVQQNIGLVLNQVTKLPFNDGTLVTNIILPAGSSRVNHKLSRQPLGFYIVDTTAAATIYREAWDVNTITFNASAPVTISIVVF